MDLEENQSKSVLIIDDMANARSSLQITMSHLHFGKILTVAGVKEAINAIGSREYDVILCDYYMGEAADGQQFLEFLRAKDVIKSSTIFIIVTAEQAYTSVVAAAECAPDDYLIKPFTAAAVQARLERLFDRNKALGSAYRCYDAKDYDGLVKACDQALAAKTKFAMDALRLKGEGLIKAGRPKEAIEHYQKIVNSRDVPWARLGLAHAYMLDGQMDKAEAATRSIIRDNPKYLAAYDFLTRLLKKIGKKREALALLQKAASVSARSVSRQRDIGQIAHALGDYETSVAAMSAVIDRNKNSPMKDASDYTTLSSVLLEKGEPGKALDMLDQVKSEFKQLSNQEKILVASVAASAHKQTGNQAAAQRAVEDAIQNSKFEDSLPDEVKLPLAKACLENDRHDVGMKLMKDLLQSSPEDKGTQEMVRETLGKAGIGAEEVEKIIAAGISEVTQINNQGVILAKQGKFDEAEALLLDAVRRVPMNQQFLSNAAAILLADLDRNTISYEKLERAKELVESLRTQNSANPKLPGLMQALQRVSSKSALNF
jgi:tetratricopeptide (TPR) repeat protein